MKLVGKIPVEPLDDERLTNIERRLVVHVSELREAPARAPRRLLAFAGVAMALAIAAVVGYRLHRDPVNAAPQPETLAMTGGALDLGDAQIAGSDFTVTRSDRRVEIQMAPGRLDLHVQHDPSRLYVVRAGDVEVEDVGTRFTVDYDGTHVDVRVTEGAVKVKHAGKEVQVAADHAWGLDIGPVTIAQLDEARAPAIDVEDEVAAIEPTGDGTGSRTSATPNDTGVANGAGTGQPGRATGPRHAGSGSGSQPKRSTSKGRDALEAATIAPPIDVGIAEPRQAILEYSKRAAASKGDTTRLLYSMAVVQYRSNDEKGALRTLDGVTVREGSDAYQDGLWLAVRIRCLRSFDDECRRAAERYRIKVPSGPRTGIADQIVTEILQHQ